MTHDEITTLENRGEDQVVLLDRDGRRITVKMTTVDTVHQGIPASEIRYRINGSRTAVDVARLVLRAYEPL